MRMWNHHWNIPGLVRQLITPAKDGMKMWTVSLERGGGVKEQASWGRCGKSSGDMLSCKAG
jgi:hypothetical protein